MISVRPAETDGDLEGWIRVKRAVVPDEQVWSVQDFREREDPERLVVVAELDGEIVGAGIAGRSDVRTRGFVKPRVIPDARRRGVGTALLRDLGRHVEGLGFETTGALVGDPGSRAFAERFGFEEVDRQVQQVLALSGHVQHVSPLPEGVQAVTIAERPDLLRDAYPLGVAGWADMAIHGTATIDLDDWLRDEATLPAGSFVALEGEEIIGYSGLCALPNDGDAEDGLTAIRRDWRRRGLGRALKEREIAWAAENGIRRIITWTQRGNDGMRALNERLGYVYCDVEVTMHASLPLKGLA